MGVALEQQRGTHSEKLSRIKKANGNFVGFYPLGGIKNYEGWNFNSGNYLFTIDTK